MPGKFFSIFENDRPELLTGRNNRWYKSGRRWPMPLISIHDETPAPADRTKWYVAAVIVFLLAAVGFAVCSALKALKVF